VSISYQPMEAEISASKSLVATWRRLRWKLRWVWVGKTWESMLNNIQGSLDSKPVGNSTKMG
jgi:hypothetical protein